LSNEGAALNLRFADFEIDLARQEMRRTGAIVHVEPQVFDLLVHLIRNRDRIVSKDELFEAIWQGRIVSEATLSSRISAARRALGDSGNDQSFIRTLHKRGFRFLGDVECDGSAPAVNAIETGVALEGPVHEAAKLVPAHASLPLSDEPSASAPSFDDVGRGPDQEYLAHGLAAAVAGRPALADRVSDAADDFAMLPADAGAAAAAPTKAEASNGRRITRNLLVTIGAVALVSLAAPAAWWLLLSPSTPYVKDRGAVASEVVSSEDRLNAWTPSIVVLPFANLSGDPKRDYLADGITDSLISDLAHALPGVPIVSRDTAFTYKGRGADAREIGRELEVRYLLEGSVVLDGEHVRVNTRLVETKEASQLWAERFDAELKSILQVQDEIVSRVSRAIGLQVVDIEARRSWRERPDSAELIDLVMRGKSVLNLPSSQATMIEARGLFEQAVNVEPASVDGLAGVATTLVFEFLNGYYDTGGGRAARQGGAAPQSRARDRAPSPHGFEGVRRVAPRAGQIR
jgi:TolB-like protein/DNA-binding winged helix-turn-helix (wHTH) protein